MFGVIIICCMVMVVGEVIMVKKVCLMFISCLCSVLLVLVINSVLGSILL